MKVLHAISSGGMYGAETMILTLCRAMHAAEPGSAAIAVFLNTSQPETVLYEAARADGIPAYLVRCDGRIDRSTADALRTLMADTGSDLLHAHGYKADLYSYVAMRPSSQPLVSTCHNWTDADRNTRTYGYLDRLALRRFDRIAAVSEGVRQRLEESGVQGHRICVLPNGIDTARFRSAARSAPPDRPLTLGFAGRLSHEKGIDIFLQVAQAVLREEPNVRFAVAGDGPERAATEAAMQQSGLASYVRLLGRREDMAEVYRSFDILLSTSRTEGLPMGLMEAMANALPIVATAVGDVPALLNHGQCGLLAPSLDIAALTSSTLRLLRDAALRIRLGNAGHERVETYYSVTTMLRHYLDFYQRALELKR